MKLDKPRKINEYNSEYSLIAHGWLINNIKNKAEENEISKLLFVINLHDLKIKILTTKSNKSMTSSYIGKQSNTSYLFACGQ